MVEEDITELVGYFLMSTTVAILTTSRYSRALSQDIISSTKLFGIGIWAICSLCNACIRAQPFGDTAFPSSKAEGPPSCFSLRRIATSQL
jgi:hypothetical protein